MTHVNCRLTANNRDQLRNPTLGNRVWTTFTFLMQDTQYSAPGRTAQYCNERVCLSVCLLIHLTNHIPILLLLLLKMLIYKLRWLWCMHVCYLRPLLRSSLANCDMLSTLPLVLFVFGQATQYSWYRRYRWGVYSEWLTRRQHRNGYGGRHLRVLRIFSLHTKLK